MWTHHVDPDRVVTGSQDQRKYNVDATLPCQASIQRNDSQPMDPLSPARETLMAGVMTIKTLQKSMRARRQSNQQTACTPCHARSCST